MKTEITSKKRLMFFLAIMFGMTFFNTGCAKKKTNSSGTRVRARSTNYGNTLTDPRTGQPVVAEWGQIYGFSQQVLSNFLNNPSDLTYVSPNPYDRTGIRFRGSLSSRLMEILVWDERTEQSANHEGYNWKLSIQDYYKDSRYSDLIVIKASDLLSNGEVDNSEQISLEGYISGSNFQGSVFYIKPGMSAAQKLGDFVIPTAEFINK